jgi:hypothetical protein
MDPNANLEQQLDLAREITEDNPDADNLEAVEAFNERQQMRADQLAEHVIALHEWITNGGFLPSEWEAPGAAQGRALWRLMAVQDAAVERLHPSPFDLPAGYWGVRLTNGFECGIAPDGAVSS